MRQSHGSHSSRKGPRNSSKECARVASRTTTACALTSSHDQSRQELRRLAVTKLIGNRPSRLSRKPQALSAVEKAVVDCFCDRADSTKSHKLRFANCKILLKCIHRSIALNYTQASAHKRLRVSSPRALLVRMPLTMRTMPN